MSIALEADCYYCPHTARQHTHFGSWPHPRGCRECDCMAFEVTVYPDPRTEMPVELL